MCREETTYSLDTIRVRPGHITLVYTRTLATADWPGQLLRVKERETIEVLAKTKRRFWRWWL